MLIGIGPILHHIGLFPGVGPSVTRKKLALFPGLYATALANNKPGDELYQCCQLYICANHDLLLFRNVLL